MSKNLPVFFNPEDFSTIPVLKSELFEPREFASHDEFLEAELEARSQIAASLAKRLNVDRVISRDDLVNKRFMLKNPDLFQKHPI